MPGAVLGAEGPVVTQIGRLTFEHEKTESKHTSKSVN